MLEQHVDVVPVLERTPHVCHETSVKGRLLVVEVRHHLDFSLDVGNAVLVKAVSFGDLLDSPISLCEFVHGTKDLRILAFSDQVFDREPVDADF